MPTCKCGNQTANLEGICAICEMDNKNPRLKEVAREIMGKSDGIKDNRKCKAEGCEKYRVKDGYCVRHWKESMGMKAGKAGRHKNWPTKSPEIPSNTNKPIDCKKRANGTSKLIETLTQKRDDFRRNAHSLDLAIRLIEEEINKGTF